MRKGVGGEGIVASYWERCLNYPTVCIKNSRIQRLPEPGDENMGYFDSGATMKLRCTHSAKVEKMGKTERKREKEKDRKERKKKEKKHYIHPARSIFS